MPSHQSPFHLSFLGAAQTVTGSRYLLECGERRILVDCGLFQGYKHLRLKNWSHPPFEPASIDVVLLTHAHLDHSGYTPLLVKRGFGGPVYATAPTVELCGILLPDSGHLQEEQAAFANRHKFSKHSPALPLYTQAEAEASLAQLRPTSFDQALAPAPGVRATFHRAGHLLGAASVRVEHGGASILFSGDLGRPDDALMPGPAAPPASDYIVIESTYGDRKHPAVDLQFELGEAIRRVHARGGVIVMPTFAVGRAQLLLLLIARLQAAGEIPSLPVFLDSPMAIDATAVFLQFLGEHHLKRDELEIVGKLTKLVRTPEESKSLDRLETPALILAASGMATGGRVLHHLKVFAPEPRNLVLFAGYQAGGTRGAALVGGAKSVRIHGEEVPIRAEVAQLSASSAHADGDELIKWLRRLPRPPRHVFVTHGEEAASDTLRRRIETELGWSASAPEFGERVAL